MAGDGAAAPVGAGRLMAKEIGEQPEALARQLDEGLAAVRAVAAAVRRADPSFVLLAGRGTSDHAALYAKYLVEVVLGRPAGLASLSTLTAYGARPRLRGALWIAVSQSGRSPDLVASTTVAAELGALTLAVTNAPDSPLATAAKHHIDVLAGQERAVAATKSYTAQLLALWLFVDAWAGGGGEAAFDVPAVADEVLSRSAAREVADRYRFVDKLVTTSRGFAYPTAREAALKMMETSYLSAHAFSGADLLHGPLAMIDQDRPVIAVVPDGVGGRALAPVLDRLREHNAEVCVVGDPTAWNGSGSLVPLPSGIDEQLAPIVQILPLQQMAHAIAVARNYDPDSPRGLRKVTQTW